MQDRKDKQEKTWATMFSTISQLVSKKLCSLLGSDCCISAAAAAAATTPQKYWATMLTNCHL